MVTWGPPPPHQQHPWVATTSVTQLSSSTEISPQPTVEKTIDPNCGSATPLPANACHPVLVRGVSLPATVAACPSRHGAAAPAAARPSPAPAACPPQLLQLLLHGLLPGFIHGARGGMQACILPLQRAPVPGMFWALGSMLLHMCNSILCRKVGVCRLDHMLESPVRLDGRTGAFCVNQGNRLRFEGFLMLG
jgi:hypothetical protein